MTVSRLHARSIAVRHAILAVAILATVLTCASCRQKPDPQTFVSAQTALAEGLKAHENKDYQAAVSSLDTALSGGGLMPDLYSQALLTRAECNARLGNFPPAHADLDKAARGAEMSDVHRVRSFVYAKEGNTPSSRSELSAAKRINPRIQAIRD